jgi:D-glycero-D-manno-heptose 1,7-bisphosphate phosphatase
MSLTKNRALFLDRDGVVIEDHGFVYRIEDVIFQKGMLELGRFFTAQGWKIIVVSNQSGIARGYFTAEEAEAVHRFISEKFTFHRVYVTDFFYCPHYPPITGSCRCRKPEPGMFLEAAAKHSIDLSNSIMVGDKGSDMQAAAAAGISNRFFLQGQYEYSPEPGVRVIRDLREILDMDLKS